MLTLSRKVDECKPLAEGTVDCAALGYVDQQPSSDAAVALADQGYYALSCRSGNSRVFDIMEPYKEVSTFLIFLVVIGGAGKHSSLTHRYTAVTLVT